MVQSVNETKKWYLGVDIGGTAAKIGLVDDDGNVLATEEYSVNHDHYETPVLTTVLSSIAIFLQKSNVSLSSLQGIGVSATGQIDRHQGKVIGTGGNFKNYDQSEIKKEIEAKFGLPCVVMNDANCMVLGELWKGAGKGYRHIVAFTVGTGVGGGIIANGSLLEGRLGIAGEIGHYPINIDDRLCTCGNRGCFEQYASTTALVKNMIAAISNGQLNWHPEVINGRSIFEAVAAGHQGVKQVVDRWISDIAQGSMGLIHIFNPELLLVGGGVSVQTDHFILPLEAMIRQRCMPRFSEGLVIKAAQLGNIAGLLGAVLLLRQELTALRKTGDCYEVY